MKPGSCAFPYFGILLTVIDPSNGQEVEWVNGKELAGVLCVKNIFPSSARTVYGDHTR